ncbi:hypothetical protein QL093DRAFT_2590846 [Fusarium oxysporum]|nr:hypothetical protein QL093DRAFT_2590846 [Fusarium oxysporum]
MPVIEIPKEQWAQVLEKPGGLVVHKKVPVHMPGPDEVLVNICNFLKSFTDATTAAEGHAHAIDRTLPIMDFLFNKFEAALIEYVDDAFMALCIDAGRAKLDAYCTPTERSSAYVSNRSAVEDLWKSRYAPVAKSAESSAQSLVEKTLVENSFLAWEDEHEDPELPTLFDEYLDYISAPRIKVKDVRRCWPEGTQQTL